MCTKAIEFDWLIQILVITQQLKDTIMTRVSRAGCVRGIGLGLGEMQKFEEISHFLTFFRNSPAHGIFFSKHTMHAKLQHVIIRLLVYSTFSNLKNSRRYRIS